MMSFANSNNFISFSIWIPFDFLLLLPWLGLPKLCWIKVVRVDILFLFLRKCFQVFIIEYDVCSRFVTYGLYYVEMSSFLESFYHKLVWNCVKRFLFFLHLLRWIMWLDVMYHTDWFVDTEKSLHPCDKFHTINWS